MRWKKVSEDPGYQQLIVLIDPNLKKEVKQRAIRINATMKAWVLQAIHEKIKREDMAQ